ncbi:MAG: tetratricopeptide repeat protein [Candidatus Hodarchaeales archaeon]|jgi:tetratricopeptide (TPR) repeat protein
MNLLELLTRVKQLKNQGNFREALSEIELVERTTNLSDEEHLTCLCQKQELLLKLGELSRVLQIGSQVIKESEKLEKSLQTVDAIIFNATALRIKGKYKEALALVERGEQILKTVTNFPLSEIKTREASLLLRKGRIYCDGLVDHDYCSKCVQESLTIYEELGNKTGIAWCYDKLANIEKDHKVSLEKHYKTLVLFEEISDKEGIAWSHFSIGVIQRFKGEMEKASKHLLKSLAIFEEIDNKIGLAFLNGSVGRLYVSKGELNIALRHLEKSRILYNEIGDKFWIGLNLGRIGDVYYIKGELDRSLEAYMSSIANYNEMESIAEHGKGLSFSKIGKVYQARGEIEEAYQFYQKSLAIYEKKEDLLYKHFPLYNLIKLNIERKDPEKINLYLQQLKQVNDREDNKYIDQYYRVGKATVLKASNRVIHRAEAQKLFQQVVEEEVTDIEISVEAILNLCELLLDEFRAFKDEEVFQEVKELSNKLLQIAKDQNSYSLLGETYLLQAKLALLDLDLEQAQKLLIQAKQTAEGKGLHKLAQIISVEYDLLEEQMTMWEKLMEKDLSKGEMLEVTQFEDLLERLLSKRLYRSDKEISEYIAKARQIVETIGN